ncbi:MAG: hypothetical protein SGPRY_014699, partial [Prymnesium sp.]
MLFDTAFTAVGSAAGAAVGYLGYSLLLNQLSTGIILLTHDLTYWICIIGGGIAGAVVLARLQQDILILATAMLVDWSRVQIPAFAVLVLSRLDPRYLWVLQASAVTEHLFSPFVYLQASTTDCSMGCNPLAYSGLNQPLVYLAYPSDT